MALPVLRAKADPEGAKGALAPRPAGGAGTPILGAGARCPLGLTALEVAMCARAHKLDVWPTPFEDRWRYRIGASRARYLPDDLHGWDRLVALGAPALREAAAGLPGPLPLYLAVAEPGRPDDDPRMGPELIAALARASGVAIDVERSVVVRSGHAGGGMALELALLRMRDASLANRPTMVIVGGLDSYYHGDTLRWLDAERRLHSQGAVDGFFPGEGAAFVVVAASADEVAAKAGAPAVAAPIATVVAAASGREETVGTGEPNIAVAMTRAVRSAAEAARGAPIAWVLSDLNGERHRLDEWTKVALRSKDLLAEDPRHDRLPAMMGDVGAASGPMALVIASTWLRTGAAPAPRALIALHAEGQDRAVTVVEAAAEAPAPAATAPRRREAPAKATSPVLEEAIERVTRSLSRLPKTADRGALETFLTSALVALSRWAKTDLLADDHLAMLAGAAERVAAARHALEPFAADETGAQGLKTLRHVESSLAACREVTIGEIVAEQDVALRGGRADEPAPAPSLFRASAGAPLVHASERDPLLPLDVIRDAKTPEEAALRAIARDALEDVSILGGLRQPNDDEPWTRTDAFEARLLANIDALASLDRAVAGPELGIDVPSRVLAYTSEAAWADAGRAFTRAFALSCFGAEDTVRAAVEGLRRSHPITHSAQQDAFCLGPSPRIVPAMERLLWDDDPALVRLAAEVLRFRRAATLPAMLPLLSHPDVGVLEAAARAMGAVESRAAAIAALGGLLREGVEDRVAVAALESLVLLGDPSAIEQVAARLLAEEARPGTLSTPGRVGLLRLVAVAGGAEHAGLLVRALARTPAAVTAVGWYGQAAHVEPVLEVLALANEQRSAAAIRPAQIEIDAARAVLRITGIYLEDPDEPSGIGLAMRASLWRDHLKEHPLDLRTDVRYRMGAPYRPAASLAELADEGTAAHARRWAALELAVLAGQGWQFEPGDWVARQKEQIAAMQARVEGGIGFEAGEWVDAYLRRRRAHPHEAARAAPLSS